MGFDCGAGVANSGIGADIDNSPTLFMERRHTIYIYHSGVDAGKGKKFGRGVGDVGSGKAKGAADTVTVDDNARYGIRIAKETVGILYPSLFYEVADA